MVYKADEALAQLRKSFDGVGSYEMLDSDANNVRVQLTVSGVAINTWFDVQKQCWGFDLLNGGHKSCSTVEDFEDALSTYISIQTDLIPKAKTVCDVFEQDIGISTVYDNFSGTKQKGYSVRFKVLGATDDRGVLVQQVPEGYVVRLVVPDEASERFRVKLEYKYDIVEDGSVISLPTIHSLMRQFAKRYPDGSNTTCKRVAQSMFSLSIEGLDITADVIFNYSEVRYHITQVGCYDSDFIVTPSDPYDLSEVYMKCKDFFDDESAAEDDEEPVTDTSEAAVAAAVGKAVTEVLGEQAAQETPFEFNSGVVADVHHSDGFEEADEEKPAGEESVSFDEPAEDAGSEPDEETSSDSDFSDGFEEPFGSQLFGDDKYGVEEGTAPAEEPDFGDEPESGASEEPDDGVEEPAGHVVFDQSEFKAHVEEPAETHRTKPVYSSLDTGTKDGDELVSGSQTPGGIQGAGVEIKSTVQALVVESMKMVVEGGEKVGVQFIANGQPYIFGVAEVSAAGVPVKRIKETVQVVYKCGLRMTEDELRLKKYADEPNERDLERIIEAVFA